MARLDREARDSGGDEFHIDIVILGALSRLRGVFDPDRFRRPCGANEANKSDRGERGFHASVLNCLARANPWFW